jgi:phosphodiesterase/alkaline phosphatase D-like protein
VIIKNLQPSTTYYYRVDSSNAQDTGTSVASDLQQFQTKDASVGSQKALPQRSVLAGPVVQDLTPTAATLWWHSDQSVSSQVIFGLSQASLDRVAEDVATGSDHRAQLAGLEPGKAYFYSIGTADGSPVATGQFSTPQQEAPSSAKITNGPVIEYVGHNHAIIAWSTSAPASTIVKYGTDPNALSQTAQAPWGSTTHRVDVKNLQPNTKYYFAVESNQPQGTGNVTQSAPGQLHTVGQGQQALALTPPR